MTEGILVWIVCFMFVIIVGVILTRAEEPKRPPPQRPDPRLDDWIERP